MVKSFFGLGGKSNTATLVVDDDKSNGAKVSQNSSMKTVKSKKKSKSKAPAKLTSTAQEQTLVEKYRDSFAGNPTITFLDDSASVENKDLVIRAAYKQVFGNAHLMESERLSKAESEMRFGQITVRDFVRRLATSERYRMLFWQKYPTSTFVELNFKHLLGRAPENYQEVAKHMKLLAESGFEAEIDSYLDSEEYAENFGDFSVPYFRGYSSQTGRNAVGFTHSFPLSGVACSSDKSLYNDLNPKLQANLINNRSSGIPSIRPIPESYPETFAAAPEPRIPKEYKDMAYEILKNLRNSPKYRNYLNNPYSYNYY